MGLRGVAALTPLPGLRSYDKAWLDAATPDLVKGLRGGVATLVPFYLAIWLGRQEFAWMALGGWLGTLVDPGGLRSTRAKTTSARSRASASFPYRPTSISGPRGSSFSDMPLNLPSESESAKWSNASAWHFHFHLSLTPR